MKPAFGGPVLSEHRPLQVPNAAKKRWGSHGDDLPQFIAMKIWRTNAHTHTCMYIYIYMAMDQYLYIPFLGEWTSIYQLFWCSPGVQGFDPSPYIYIYVYMYKTAKHRLLRDLTIKHGCLSSPSHDWTIKQQSFMNADDLNAWWVLQNINLCLMDGNCFYTCWLALKSLSEMIIYPRVSCLTRERI